MLVTILHGAINQLIDSKFIKLKLRVNTSQTYFRGPDRSTEFI